VAHSFCITKEFTFDAAHSLPHLPVGHKCHRLHGHTYTVRMVLASDKLTWDSFVRDYADLDEVKTYIDTFLDHQDLNEALSPLRTTAELIAQKFYNEFVDIFPELVSVGVSETPRTWAFYGKAWNEHD
jgi:6-pyruvoyltetrahydropterin/6-carboxytetrahydropterin synthase